jgi:hypothetical protein
MTKQETRTLYTIEEIRDRFPDAYDKIREDWCDAVDQSGDTPWSEEIMGSLEATIAACGAELTDWSIGPYSPSDLTVSVDDFFEDGEDTEEKKDSAWFFDTILRPFGYKAHKEKGVDFPGLCPLTGICFDDDFLESVYQDLQRDCTLSESLENLADRSREKMEEEIEGEKDEEWMLGALSDMWYTEDGEEA